MSATLDLQLATQAINIPSQALILEWIENVFADQHIQSKEITIRIVDTAEIQQINADYRGKDKPTNVLSFPYELPDIHFAEGEVPQLDNDFIGDLVICAQVVEKEAKQQNKDINAHWAHMMIHGTLHLLGFDHIEDDEAEKMENLEIRLLAKLGIDDPYQDH